MRRLVLVLGLLSLLSACGFRLQGSDTWPQEFSRYQLDYPARDLAMASFVDFLEQALAQRNLQAASDAPLRIVLHELTDRKTVAAIGGDGKAVEFDISRQLEYQLVTPDWRSDLFRVSSSRRLSFDPTVVLAKHTEERRLRDALSRDLIEVVLLRAEKALQARVEALPQGS